jgi:3-hydroxy acid dehydrogenase/malonic semialdehyde reductase
MLSLKGKIVFITGASSGIGESTAQAFAAQGAKMLMCARRAERLEKLALTLEFEYGVAAHYFRLDVRDQPAVEKAVAGLPPEWRAIEILVNNAGLSRGLDKLPQGLLDDWEEMIDTNVKGLLYVSRAVIPGMIERGRGHIVNIGSIAGHEVYPGGNVYCATKFAVRALSKGLRLDLSGTPIRVSEVAPGMVDRVQPRPLPRRRGEGGKGLSGPHAARPGRRRRRRRLVRDEAAPRQRQRDRRHAHGPGLDDARASEIIRGVPESDQEVRSEHSHSLEAGAAVRRDDVLPLGKSGRGSKRFGLDRKSG